MTAQLESNQLNIENLVDQVQAFLRTQRAAEIALLLFSLFLLYTFVQLTTAFWPVRVKAETNSVLQARVQPLPDIPGWHLFGNYAIVKAKLLPQSQLNLTLEGIFYSSNPQQSQALIATTDVPVKIYKIGAELPGGAKVKEILPDSVIIEQNNKLANLPLKKPRLKFAPKPKGFNFLKE